MPLTIRTKVPTSAKTDQVTRLSWRISEADHRNYVTWHPPKDVATKTHSLDITDVTLNSPNDPQRNRI